MAPERGLSVIPPLRPDGIAPIFRANGLVQRERVVSEEAKNVEATVKWYKTDKGFGFVRFPDGSPDAFVHSSVLVPLGLTALPEGATLVCDVAENPKGRQVAAIHSVTPPETPARRSRPSRAAASAPPIPVPATSPRSLRRPPPVPLPPRLRPRASAANAARPASRRPPRRCRASRPTARCAGTIWTASPA
ncbi:cold-shock protein [Azospirillum thermophilum]|uniref:CSD domain-containing protein n=1 Tax=Azospirillum thermophilum TaxID=2202148 RepID=A0A2S2CW32_9PROT|nr:cold shock domain-containing protein [Azospirillum thermophilum]AWK88497.1 hypothetical protein DEW08_20770 [Azospirillum thermophilum]